nr:unnamed protein product [Spirometra erinaceieuropaei]
MRGSYYFVIVSHEDYLIFELAQPGAPKALEQKIDLNYLTQFVAHASLDMVDENMWNTPSTYLKFFSRSSLTLSHDSDSFFFTKKPMKREYAFSSKKSMRRMSGCP